MLDKTTAFAGFQGRVALAVLTVFLTMAPLALAEKDPGTVETSFDGRGFEVRYTATFSADALIFGELLGYDTVRLKDGDWVNEPGQPMLPAKELRIALPAGMAVTGLRVVDTEVTEIAGQYSIFPAQPPRRTSEGPSADQFVPPDPETYGSAEAYPLALAEFTDQTDLTGQGIAVVRLYPVRYVPAQQALSLCTSISFVLEGVEGYECGDYLPARVSRRGEATYTRMVRNMVVNPQDVELRSAPTRPPRTRGVDPGNYEYVIITATSWLSDFQPLADWRTKTGMPATIVITSWIYSEYSGASNQEKIRNFVIDAHNTWGANYFLMGGEDETVPFESRYYYGENTPSDQYYSDFDDDWTHEVFVGRLTVANTTQIDRVISKILTYETDPPLTDYARKALLIGMDLDASTHAEELKETIAGHITGYDPGFDITKVYDSDLSNHRTAAIAALNAGNALVNHADHSNYWVMGLGSENHNWHLDFTDVNNLTNDGEMSVIVSVGCYPNAMDENDCISERFVIYNTSQAGIAFIGNTRSGYYSTGSPGMLSGRYDRDWWKGLFEANMYILGETLIYSKHASGQVQNIKKHCEWTFNLLGDPGMPIWTDDPEPLTVTHDATLPVGATSFDVHVEDTSGNLQGATVCLWKAGDVYLTDTTNSSGDAFFAPAPGTVGTMYVTATKRNCKPYMGSAQVEECPDCPEDLNGDGFIDLADLAILLAHYGTTGGALPEEGDINGDGNVDLADLAMLLAVYGTTCP